MGAERLRQGSSSGTEARAHVARNDGNELFGAAPVVGSGEAESSE